MVVVLIIGVMATFAVMSIGGRSLDDGLETEARRLRELLVLAADEAVLQGTELGFRQTDEGYQFLRFESAATPDGEPWVPVDDDPALRARKVPAPLFLDLRVEGRAVVPAAAGDPPGPPHVLLSSSGEMTAFRLRVRARDHAPHYQLDADVVGQMTLERKEAP